MLRMYKQLEQSNAQWRRQINLADTAAQNQINLQNVQNQFQLTSQAQAFLWQELRDQADFDFRKTENDANRTSQLIGTVVAADPKRYTSQTIFVILDCTNNKRSTG